MLSRIFEYIRNNKPILLSLKPNSTFSLINHEIVHKLERELTNKGYRVIKAGYLKLFNPNTKTLRGILDTIDDKSVVILDGIFIYGGLGELKRFLRGKKVIFLTSIPLSALRVHDPKPVFQDIGDLEIMSLDNEKGEIRDITIVYGEGSSFSSFDAKRVIDDVEEKYGAKIETPVVILAKKKVNAEELAKILSERIGENYKIVLGSQQSYDSIPAEILAGIFGVLGYIPKAKTVIICRRVNVFEALEIIYRTHAKIISLYEWESPVETSKRERTKERQRIQYEPDEYRYVGINRCILLSSGRIICGTQIVRYATSLISRGNYEDFKYVLRRIGFTDKFVEFLLQNIDLVKEITPEKLSKIFRPTSIFLSYYINDMKKALSAYTILREKAEEHLVLNELERFMHITGIVKAITSLKEYAKTYIPRNFVENVRKAYQVCRIGDSNPSIAEVLRLVENDIILRHNLYCSKWPVILVDASRYEPVYKAIQFTDKITTRNLKPFIVKLSKSDVLLRRITKILRRNGLDISKAIVYAFVSDTNKEKAFSFLEELIERSGAFQIISVESGTWKPWGNIRRIAFYETSPRVLFYYWLHSFNNNILYPNNLEGLVIKSRDFIETVIKRAIPILSSKTLSIFKSEIKAPSDDICISLAIKHGASTTCLIMKEYYTDEYLFKCISKSREALEIIQQILGKHNIQSELDKYKDSVIWRLTADISKHVLVNLLNDINRVEVPKGDRITLIDIKLPKYMINILSRF